jgi:hypothetical protein
LDYFLARYYSSAQGRFTSPDEFTGGPVELFDFAAAASNNPTFYADIQEPQSLNKYQYAYNNPLIYIDPNGHQGLRRKVEDVAVGAGKEVANTGIGFLNTITAMSPIRGDLKAALHVEEYKPSNDTQDAAMAITFIASLAIPGPGEAKAGVKGAELAARAVEIQSALKVGTAGRTTTAVLEGVNEVGNTVKLVASSEKDLRLVQKGALQSGETAVSGVGHAEVTALNAAKEMGVKATSVAASRGICLGCGRAIIQSGARIASPLKKSVTLDELYKGMEHLRPR